jgi:hypothetical protein
VVLLSSAKYFTGAVAFLRKLKGKVLPMVNNTQEKKDRERNIKVLLRRWLKKQETAEKAKLILKKGSRTRSAK